eukprot:CAMPEP_0182927760 /NCGR_PEP_ID=MMETSP0105_2-20130417/14120_1 /TAXON_ID=81532 ORGANISM="Acanthoeca-like sp., Strain 10tr" /NCGR_SAMPLE_ID=MMETSP0105_2 /ASSEMBLY_ACC=CAM_ASM_000205 /LENGTH=60 /DNA_ID=CAMNT_0025065727 /DNA_START=5 /DNA_END=183 /DNA_ORIENTATION=+
MVRRAVCSCNICKIRAAVSDWDTLTISVHQMTFGQVLTGVYNAARVYLNLSYWHGDRWDR